MTLNNRLGNTSGTKVSTFFSPKVPVGLNFQLAFPLGTSKRIVPPREGSRDSDDIEDAPIGRMYGGTGVYLR